MSMPPARRRTALVASVLAVSLLGTGCSLKKSSNNSAPPPAPITSVAPSDSASPTPSASSGPVTGKLTVLAAASLTDVFQQLKTVFQQQNPGVDVEFSFGGSSTLAQQIVAKAPADVFAAASPTTMKTVTDAGDAVGTPVNFVSNILEIAVPTSNPANIASLSDLAKSGVKVAVCAPAVPCGAAAQKVFTAANLTVTPATQEQDVTGVLTKVESGEVDAGLVYQTDVKRAAGKVKGIDFPEASAAVNEYPIAALTTAANPAAAAAWVAFITGAQARQILQDAGFQNP
ncbi:MAG TPA: molybdate ABC transporter substrate-binding protein [Sporichthyaceae bacterium]|jgi:molybdate transport system substrate-binding protein|nr:molybdate ABC transporter substrate-binding protein [Sporichthyaceae bacterium]